MGIRYHMIDMTAHHSDEEVKIINQCYDFWYQAFNEDLQSRGMALNKAEFHRARILAVVESEGLIAGFHLYSVFNINESPSIHHPYLMGFPEVTKEFLKNQGAGSLMAMEYLTVTPHFRSIKLEGIHTAELVIRLGLKVLSDLGLDAAIGVARVDRKINALATSIGCEEVSSMEKYNNKCSLMYFNRHHHTVNPSIANAFIERLWSTRVSASDKRRKAS